MYIFTLLLIYVTVWFESADFVASSKHCSIDLDDCKNKECCDGEQKIVVCYFTNWAWYRSGQAKFGPDNIDTSLCTHINYAFAQLDEVSLTISPFDKWVDLDNKFYERVVATGLKVLISIGGWNDSAGDKWSRLLRNATARANFCTTAVAFLETYGFSGLDVDYEYPGCPQGNRTAGLPTDKENFNLLLSELKTAFNGKYLLTVATSAGKSTIDECYNMVELNPLVDWVNVMAYDYHSYLEGETGANAPVCSTHTTFGVIDTVKYYIDKLKFPADKLVLGIPLYGKTFTLADLSPPRFGVATTAAGTAGNYTREAGVLSYYEICSMLKNDWFKCFNIVNGTYAWQDNQFVSYDSEDDIVRKSCFINKRFKLKGAMVWALDFDDFNNMCGSGVYPLMTTLNQQLRCL